MAEGDSEQPIREIAEKKDFRRYLAEDRLRAVPPDFRSSRPYGRSRQAGTPDSIPEAKLERDDQKIGE
jgi:hypothetical protein